MPRKAHPWYRASRKMWYVNVGGRQVPLNITDPKDEAAAWAAFQELLRREAGKSSDPPGTAAELVAAYLADAETRVKTHTLKVYRWYLGEFLARHGTIRLQDLTARRVEDDAKRTTWTDTTRCNYLATVETCLRWGQVKVSFQKPSKASAGAASVISEETYRRMLMHCRGDWAACVRFLWETGARPSEAAAVTAEAVDWEQRVARLREHKTAHRTQRDRLIYLNPAAFEVCQWQRERHKAGLLFRSWNGGPFSRQAFVMKFTRLSGYVGRKVTAYSLRHSFASRALAAGESDAIVAALLGHANTAMIHRHYSHLSEFGRALRDAAERIGKAAG